MSGRHRAPAILLTGAGKRYDIVSCFARADDDGRRRPPPLAPGAVRGARARGGARRSTTPATCPRSRALCERHGVGAVLPLTDLDIEVLARAREQRRLPALVPPAEVARATYDKYEAHLLLERLGAALAADGAAGGGPRRARLPGDGQAAPRLGRALDPPRARRRAGALLRRLRRRGADRGCGRAGDGAARDAATSSRSTASATCDGRCLNAIPRTMLESRGGESIKGQVVHDEELIELGRRVMEALRVRGPATIQVFRDPDVGLGITDVNTRFGGAFPAPVYAALPGRSYPELIVRMAAGERDRAARRRVPRGHDVHPLLLAAGARRAAGADRAARSCPAARARRARRALDRQARCWRSAVGLELAAMATSLADSPPAPAERAGAAERIQRGSARASRRFCAGWRTPCARARTAPRRWPPARTGACSAAPARPAASARGAGARRRRSPASSPCSRWAPPRLPSPR